MLTITYLQDNTIKLQSEQIQAMIDNIANYNRIVIKSTINCCPEIFTDDQTIGSGMDTTKIVIVSNGIIVKPAFFNLLSGEKLRDGVYSFSVKLFRIDNTYDYEESCAFIDVTYKCRVAETVKNLLDNTEDGQCSTVIHVLHYALVNGSNCGCNCKELCDVFKELTKLLIPIASTVIPSGCGCS